jgi:hypothetical protein
MLKRLALKYWPMIVLLISIGTILYVSRYAEERKAEKQKDAQSRSPQTTVTPSDASKGIDKAEKTEHHPDWVDTFTWPEGATVWALFLTLVVIAWQSTETRDAAKAANAQIKMMKNKERARIVVDFPSSALKLEDGPEWTKGLGAVYVETPMIVANWGGTNAFNVTARAAITDTPNSPPFSDEVSVLSIPAVFKPNIEPLAVDVATLLKGINHLAAVENRFEILYLVGRITYDDIFEESHETQFRYRWEVDGMNVEGQHFDTSKWERTSEGNWAT